ncbi:helix-turn-helix domain-containing protein [Paenibacillus yanchengensis]|uniref:Helix-turn-helix domain-containing protein n=1 Tax=Paenibacillus yanchengensis TaxID=2035833 RepID=A0ABW4YKG5_9BACL
MSPKYKLICNLNNILQTKNITPYRLAKDTQERIGTIYKLVSNDIEDARIPATLIANICGYLNITMGELFTVIPLEEHVE